MATTDAAGTATSDWRGELPTLASRLVLVREPGARDAGALLDVLSAPDACRFGIEGPLARPAVEQMIDRVRRERAAGVAFTYVITLASTRVVAGLISVRQTDPAFEGAEWECTLAPAHRGTGVFLDAARLVGTFAFGTVGTHRLEARVMLNNGRASGALRKVGAVQEGVLRRSIRRGGEYVDQVLWSVLKDDWTEQWVKAARRVH